MKNSFLIALTTGLFFTVTIPITIISCSKHKTSTDTTTPAPAVRSTSSPTANKQKCCEVSCEHGSCSAYGSSCNCTCTLLGKPNCTSNGNNISVQANATWVPFYEGMAELMESFQNEHGNASAHHIRAINELMEANNNFLEEPDAVNSYKEHVEALVALEPSYSPEELIAINNYMAGE